MSKSFRSILVLLLSLTLIALPLCGLNASAEGETEVTVIAEGNCGPKDGEGAFSDSVIYTITSDGVLTFSGAGPTGEFDSVAIAFGGQPWKAYADQFSAVVVERGVTSVGKAFFKDLVNIRTVTLAASVASIGESAFEGCSGLSGISLPDGLRSIGGSAFRECAALRGVVIPAGVTSFGENVFRDCEDLRSAVLSESFGLIPYRTFYNCGNLKTVTIPGSVTRVDEGAFFKCGELDDVYYLDTLSRWNTISIDDTKIMSGLTMVNGNKALSEARIHSHYPEGGTSYYESQGTATAPTCEEPGGYYRTERCSYCGAEIETKWIQTASPLGHLYGEGVVTEPATATTPGVMTYTCQRDPSHFYTEVIPAAGQVATAIADPVSDIVGFQSDPSGRCDYVLYLPAEAFVDNYEAARHAENSSEGCADTYYSLNNAVFDQNGDLMAAARTEARDICYPGLLRVQVTQDGKMYVRFAYPNNANSCDICLDIVQTYGSLTQTTSVRIEQTRNRNSAEFEFRDDAGRLFLKYRYGEPYIEQDPKVLKAQAYASCWLDLVSPWFTHTVSPNGYDIYTVNQDGILPVYPPKASDDRNHYEFDHWATDALLTGTDRPLDLETIDEWFDYYSPNYKCAVFYPVYKAVEHTFVEHTDTPATCETDGTGRYVCADCGFEGESYAIPAIAHRNAYEVAETEATAAVHGHTAGVYCPDCAAWLSGHEVIHNTLGERTYLDEYTEEGNQMVIIVCTVCGESGLYEMVPVSPTEPTDPNGGDGPLSPFSKAIQSIVSFILRLIKWLSDLA